MTSLGAAGVGEEPTRLVEMVKARRTLAKVNIESKNGWGCADKKLLKRRRRLRNTRSDDVLHLFELSVMEYWPTRRTTDRPGKDRRCVFGEQLLTYA